jgi:serine/threonine-protein kinase
MGIVYRAHDPSLNRVVALKVLLSGQFAGEPELKRFKAEAEAAARLDHANIVPIYEFGELDGRPFLSMRFVDGANLANHLHGIPMDAVPIAELMSTLARAIHYAHQRSILHRDLKPANVLLDGAGQPHVTDFGLAKCLDSNEGLTSSGVMLGSPNYMSPEQIAGKSERLTTATDIYSLGAIMYELLTGRPPFRADTPLETIRKVTEEPPLAPHLSAAMGRRKPWRMMWSAGCAMNRSSRAVPADWGACPNGHGVIPEVPSSCSSAALPY